MNFNYFEEYKGTEQIIQVLTIWLNDLIANTKFETLSIISLIGIRWGILIICEAIEKNTLLWNSFEYKNKHNFLHKLFELVYYCIFSFL